MIPLVPHIFVTGNVLDADKVNENLRAIADDIERSLDRRYTYSSAQFDLDGLADTDTAAQRGFAIRRHSASAALEVCAVELVIYSATGATWTLACSDTAWPSISVATAGATTEATVNSGVPVQVSSSTSDLTFTLSGSAANTITRGYLVVHFRADRGTQGTSHAGYSPTFVKYGTSVAGSTLDTELQAAETASGHDSTNDKDMRIEVYSARAIASAVTWYLPSGARRLQAARCYVVGTAADTARFSVSGTGLTFTTTDVVGTGTSNLVTSVPSSVSGSLADDPLTTGSDATVTITPTVGTVELAYLVLYWS